MRTRKRLESALVVFAGLVLLLGSAKAGWGSYVNNGDGTVTDTATGLMWQQADDIQERTWQNAFSYCEALNLAGHTDWRLPDVRELQSIVDDGRSGPSIDPAFSCQSPNIGYWSGSTYTYGPGAAWIVTFYHGYLDGRLKIYSGGVRCVRGGPSGSLGHSNFAFSMIASPQPINTPFSVRVAKEDGFGNTITTFNGEVSLSCSVPISPISVNLVNGVWIGEITLLEGGTNLTITACSQGVSGLSNNFNTASIATGNIGGIVKDNRRNIIQGANVHISDRVFGTDLYPPIATDGNGIYRFVNIPAGSYYIWADYGGKSSIRLPSVVSGNKTNFQSTLLVPLFSSTQRPVVLVPGIMGSTQKGGGPWYGYTPRLKSSYMELDELELFQKAGNPGWDQLKEYLRGNKGLDEGTTIIDCPWDWRRSLQDVYKNNLIEVKAAYRDYLIKAIDKAKAGNPNQKVNIIAHSMGGLLVRTYIQSDEYAKRLDIENFTMVGTPNKGSANAYFIWEGGDPKRVDNLTGSLNLYFNTVEDLYEITYNLGDMPHEDIKSHIVIRKLVQEKVPSLRQLMPTYAFLVPEEGEPYAISTKDNINSFLVDLNSDSRRFDRMGPPSSTNKVKTRIYYSDSKDTIENVDVKPTILSGQFPYDFYEDGKPSKDPELQEIGDGTVPGPSASLPCDDSIVWADCKDSTQIDADHTSLIKKYYKNIADDLYADVEQAVAQSRSNIATGIADVSTRLLISIDGRVQPYIVNPQGISVGINPVSENIDTAPGATLQIEPASGFITIDNPLDGNYVLSLKALYSEDCKIGIAYMTDAGESVVNHRIFLNPGVASIFFDLSAGSQVSIVVVHQPNPPSGLTADAIDQDGLKTSLSWNASTDPQVVGYKIYSRYIDEPFLKLIGSSVSPAFSTGDSWVDDSSIKKRLYAITATKTDDSESFLSETVTNDDRDHDGLPDQIEVSLGTYVDDYDSDGDFWTDGEEVLYGTDPLNPESIPCMGDSEPDGDVDGYDLYKVIAGNLQISVEKFAVLFGRTGCQ
jgi:hypothetical protein